MDKQHHSIYTMEYYSGIKRNALGRLIRIGETNSCTVVNQKEDKYHILIYIQSL